MGLDQYVFSSKKIDSIDRTEIAYFRKHNRLQGWMEQLWEYRKENRDEGDVFLDALDGENLYPDEFNCVPLPLSNEDLDQLENDIKNCNLPETQGFFFGMDSYDGDYNIDEDMKMIEAARKELAKGNTVVYYCWY